MEAPAPKMKGGAQMAALRAAMEAQKAAMEEAKRAAEAEQK